MKAYIYALLALAMVAVLWPTPVWTQPPADSDASRPLTAPHVGQEDVNTRYARAYLQLAKANLDVVLAANRHVANTYSGVAVERLRADVKIAEELLRQTLPSGRGDFHLVHIQSAESDRAIAELNLQNAIALNKRVPGAVSELELEKQRLAVEVARLSVERARDDANSKLELAHTQWELEQLREVVLELRVRVDQLSTNRLK
jgi:multidrug resistance efflux pump